MSERFYTNYPLTPGPFTLDGAEARHLAAASRLCPGDQVFLFNGDGQEYPATIVEMSRRDVSLEVGEPRRPEREWPFPVEVAAPLPKGDRSQFLLEKLTELGVSTFVPLACTRSVVHPRDGRSDRLERYVIEASKQCGRNVLLQIEPLRRWQDHVARPDGGAVKLLAHPGGEGGLGKPRTTGGFRLAVGPEGGFTEDEVKMASEHGWQLASLGPRILRVETAALVLATLVTLGSI